MTRTPTTLRAEQAHIIRRRNELNILGLSDWDSDAEMAAEIADLDDEIYRLEHPEEYAADPLPLSNAA